MEMTFWLYRIRGYPTVILAEGLEAIAVAYAIEEFEVEGILFFRGDKRRSSWPPWRLIWSVSRVNGVCKP